MADFFESKKSAAILKHAILSRYLVPFTAKTGSRSPQGRVAFVDGYAGEGRYEDGEPGSPALAIKTARDLLTMPRRLECMFVERDNKAFGRLKAMVEAEAGGIAARAVHGEINDHLDDVLTFAEGIPLLLFLDPYGLMIPFDSAIKPWGRPNNRGAAATEVLINFNAGAVRRICGLLVSGNGPQATLGRMDEVCGGDWWRNTWRAAMPDKDTAEKAVVAEYARRLATDGRCGYRVTEVKNKPHHKAVYYLLFLTRHPDGMYVYGEAASKGLEQWRHAVTLGDYDEAMLFDPEVIFKTDETVLRDRWIAEIEKNLSAELSKGQAFRVVDRYATVFGSTVGLARELHLRAAWKRLYPGFTRTPPTGQRLFEKWIEPA
ncbi:three-Cys-motif partner protein TcmP [Actinoplanes sp. RD1]|uniref:three-Cys-motif partner protein TcmP n=1 Tax=Actinoplanes sp. RD1 TaxID=3064538 RepID=UPI002741B266|nr:three-Cys-motif partner protein TcmP [Actinoplanes sp. RD1]